MDITNFVGIAIVGVGVSMVLEFIKAKLGNNTFSSRAVVLALSILCGGVYYFFSGAAWWASMVGVLAAASTFYAFFLAKKPSQG